MRSYTPIAYTTVRDPIHTVPRANITWLSRCEAERVEARASPPQRGPQAPAALLSRRTSLDVPRGKALQLSKASRRPQTRYQRGSRRPPPPPRLPPNPPPPPPPPKPPSGLGRAPFTGQPPPPLCYL